MPTDRNEDQDLELFLPEVVNTTIDNKRTKKCNK